MELLLGLLGTGDVSDIKRYIHLGQLGRSFTTAERVELGGLMVVKKDGRREEFSREKILLGVRKACEKRPIPQGSVEALVDDVETQVYAQGKAEVPTSLVGELVIDRLRALGATTLARVEVLRLDPGQALLDDVPCASLQLGDPEPGSGRMWSFFNPILPESVTHVS